MTSWLLGHIRAACCAKKKKQQKKTHAQLFCYGTVKHYSLDLDKQLDLTIKHSNGNASTHRGSCYTLKALPALGHVSGILSARKTDNRLFLEFYTGLVEPH